jgi:transcriptional regulator with XRE-family HTH domain
MVAESTILSTTRNTMPATAPLIGPQDQKRLALLGERIRTARKRQKVSATATAEAAGISRVTLHRIERGEPTVAIGAWVAVVSALGLSFDLVDARSMARTKKLPTAIRLGDYPQLKKLAWQLQGVDELTPQDALNLYERNWRHLDRTALSEEETALIDTLARARRRTPACLSARLAVAAREELHNCTNYRRRHPGAALVGNSNGVLRSFDCRIIVQWVSAEGYSLQCQSFMRGGRAPRMVDQYSSYTSSSISGATFVAYSASWPSLRGPEIQ